jgi:ABC-type microcin C transport system duplicated ATPase subunit YejF
LPESGIYSILDLEMRKRKPERFSAAKAVKANARERVGQPKPSRILADKPRSGRQVKHKDKLVDLLREEG